MSAEKIKTELHSYGVRMDHNIGGGRLGGAGPADGLTFAYNDLLVSAPVFSDYTKTSPYIIKRRGSSYRLYKEQEPPGREQELLGTVELFDRSSFSSRKTADGYSYEKIARVHGKDCLASTVLQSCSYWGRKDGCLFCGIGLSLKSGATVRIKTPSQLAEVAQNTLAEGINHILLTSGSTPGGEDEIRHLAQCVKEIKKVAPIPVQVQCMPPENLSLLKLLKESGANTIGIHIESLDDAVLAATAPVKAAVGREGYLDAWREAVKLFGRGQVITYIIMGLGEKISSTLKGLQEITRLGVYPFIVPLRPLPGTPAGSLLPPSPALMHEIYAETAAYLRSAELNSREINAGCGRCTACSALPDYEKTHGAEETLYCRIASGRKEKETAMKLRRLVFVEEQGLFESTDTDEHDREAVLMVAGKGDSILGTVRLYPSGEDGTWVGGRLAIAPRYRHNGIGPLLVNAAVKEAGKRNAVKFIAWVQTRNEQFFQELGWHNTGNKKTISGREHVQMQAF